MKPSIPALLLSSAPFLFLSVAPLFAPTRDPKLDALAKDVAHYIEKNQPFPPTQTLVITYLVFDFQEATGDTTQLGIQLAEEFSEALQNRSPTLKPGERSKVRELIERDHLDSAVFQLDEVALWGATTLGANLAIVGTIERGGDAINLSIRVIGHDPNKKIVLDSRQLDLTDDRRAWHGQSVPRFPPVTPWKDVPSAQSGGYSQPTCIYCSNPAYTEEARKARFQGSAKALLLIGENGNVQDAMLVEGLPCGLSSRIMSTLKGWRFQPIRAPEGKPAIVALQVEVTFRLF